MVRTRFAPSPTGELHLGGLRTALYAFLHARRHGGVFGIRIEDTDQKRFVKGSADRVMAQLRSVGLTWNEGPDVGGSFGPYVQSERRDRYAQAAQKLLDEGRAYRCDCSPERLQELRTGQQKSGKPTGYDGHCRTLARLDENAVVRFRVPEEGSVRCDDLLRGEIVVATATLDDFVIMKSDGLPTYHLAHVVDDHAMETSDVIRGEEWIPSLPKHVLLFQAFGWEIPTYAHLPLLMGANSKKLSKRDGDADVKSFLTWCLPEALINFVALLGWNPSGDREEYTLDELITSFDLARVNKAPAVVNTEKLEWFNHQAIMRKTPQELVEIVAPGFDLAAEDIERFTRAVAVEQPRLRRLDTFPTWWRDPYLQEAPLAWKKSTLVVAKERLSGLSALFEALDSWPNSPEQLEVVVRAWMTEQTFATGDTLWPFRVALSGKKASPGPFELAWVFGKKETLRRIAYAIKHNT
jgi:glutamyl-tRNA synthetase